MDINYNGIQFSIVKTNQMQWDRVFSEDGTTYLYTLVSIDVEGVLNPEAMSFFQQNGVPTPIEGNLPMESIIAIRHFLEQPRAQLVVTSSTGDQFDPTQEVIRSPLDGFDVDLNNGPRPGPCRVFNISGAKTWFIHWSCQTWVHECPNESDLFDTPILSNRYSRTDQMDEQWKSSIVTEGLAVFRTDILETFNQTADSFRVLILPPVPFGYQRRKISVTAVPSRNALRWTTVDQEKMYDLGATDQTGSFITEIQGSYAASSITSPEGIPGGHSLGTLHLRAIGDKRASNWIMTQRLVQLAAGKIPLGQQGFRGWLQHISFQQSLTDRDVSLTIVFRFAPDQQAMVGQVSLPPLRVDSIFQDLQGQNPMPPFGGGTRGTSNLMLLVAALEDACSGPAFPQCNQNDDNDNSAVQCGGQVVVSVQASDQLPIYQTPYSQSSQQGSYNVYDTKIRYYRPAGIMMGAIASPSSTYTPGGGSTGSPSSDFFRVSNAQTTVEVTFHGERVNLPVQIPDPNVTNPNYVLLDHEITPSSPTVVADASTPVFACEGRYLFGAVQAMKLNEELAMGVMPWLNFNFGNVYIPKSSYITGIIDNGNGGGAQLG
jgi:hypothetical protein